MKKKHNLDYFKQIAIEGRLPFLLAGEYCPQCNSRLGIIHPDRIWCINPKCDYRITILTGSLNDYKIEPLINKYKCPYCGIVVTRNSNKKWIKSYCAQLGKSVRIQLIPC